MPNIFYFKNFFILICLLFFSLILGACVKIPTIENINQPQTQPSSNSISQPDPAELERDYQAALKKVLEPFWSQNSTVAIKAQILDLTAPAKYLDLHFNLVIAFGLIEQGQNDSDQDKIEQGLEKISKLSQDYSWLK